MWAERLPSPTGGVDLVDARGSAVFLYGDGPSFGYLRRGPGGVSASLVRGLARYGVSAICLCGDDGAGRQVVAAAYEGGEVVVAVLRDAQAAQVLRKASLATELHLPLGLKSLPGGLLMAIDETFEFALIDWRRGTLLHRGSWRPL